MAFDPTALLTVLGGAGGYASGLGAQQAALADRAQQQQIVDENTAERLQAAQAAAQARRDAATTGAAQRTQSALQTAADKFYGDSKDRGILWAPGTVERALQASQMPTDPSNPASAMTAAMPQLMMSRAATALQAAARTGQPTPMDGGLGIVTPPKEEKEQNPVVGSPAWQSAERFKAALQPKTEPLVQVADPKNPGQSVWVSRDDAVGQQAKTTTKIESATNTAAQARLEAAVSEMNNATGAMSAYENKLRTGQANISGLGSFLGRAGSTFTHDDPASQAIQATALDALSQTNPELARYVRRGLSFAEGESMISQRPSDFRTKMAAFLSQAGAGATPEMIEDIQSRRNAIMGPLNRVVRPSAGGSAPAAAGKPMSAAAYQSARAHGYTDQEITAQGYMIPKEED